MRKAEPMIESPNSTVYYVWEGEDRVRGNLATFNSFMAEYPEIAQKVIDTIDIITNRCWSPDGSYNLICNVRDQGILGRSVHIYRRAKP